ncbi:DNA-binding protein [Streptomyces sp. ISL-14]|nr:DNA-binding protein [Streptomyces sp. ISL-14]
MSAAKTRTAWTRAAIEAEGPTTTVPVLAAALGVNKDTLYEEIRRGNWTLTRVLRIGRCIKIPTRDIITLLFASEDSAVPATGTTPHEAGTCQHVASQQVTAPSIDPQSHTSCGCTPAGSAVIRRLRGA